MFNQSPVPDLMVDPITHVLHQLPKSALIAIVGNPYTYPFHVGVEIVRRYYIDYRWYIVTGDVTQRYADILRQYGIVKDDVTFVSELRDGINVLEEALRGDGNLVYVIVNKNRQYIEDYVKVLVRRDPLRRSVAVVQVDEENCKEVAYIADLIIRLGLVEDLNSLKTISRVVKLVLIREGAAELILSYDLLPNMVFFKELTRV